MHELPKTLTESLRSFRGSVYGSRRRSGDADADLEKRGVEEENYGDRQFERALNETDASSAHHSPPISSYHLPAQYQDHDLEKQHPALPAQHAAHQNPPSGLPKHAPSTHSTPSSPREGVRETAGHGTTTYHHGLTIQDLDPAGERLAQNLTPLSVEDFCSLMGLGIPANPFQALNSVLLPDGLYAQIQDDERKKSRQFRAFDYATYALLIVQLMISAVFIILGALPHVDTHITIAILGAVATVIAGSLALMKGQGLPNRLRQTRDGLKNVLFAAEELYWDVRAGKPVLYKDIKKIREDYIKVLKEERANHPDAWTTGGEATTLEHFGAMKGTKG
ncbi:hypothetical protein BDY17DRAFT_305952 [Neohortaea acidophila]|uniref:SMODS and SLOG-associating 2TM effector domain-containing protein n=1 Tax=Neohortaea acidophila TaxID=245834 RepID=A0A6A6PFV7_9PEZI|nr:uncharacterized protein BDY17DRAFT_305952 [Neohortaea acidophila]KAF2478860.1 hypothetical protein BDY17DRAFT_305952 [Neohortaea acidophila]